MKHGGKGSPNYDVYIGRNQKSWGLKDGGWGNRFHVGRDGTVEECVQQFAEDLLRDEVRLSHCASRLKGKVLGCWCTPCSLLECHGFVLAAAAEGHFSLDQPVWPPPSLWPPAPAREPGDGVVEEPSASVGEDPSDCVVGGD